MKTPYRPQTKPTWLTRPTSHRSEPQPLQLSPIGCCPRNEIRLLIRYSYYNSSPYPYAGVHIQRRINRIPTLFSTITTLPGRLRRDTYLPSVLVEVLCPFPGSKGRYDRSNQRKDKKGIWPRNSTTYCNTFPETLPLFPPRLWWKTTPLYARVVTNHWTDSRVPCIRVSKDPVSLKGKT